MTLTLYSLLINPTSSVKNCMKKINELKYKCLIVVDKNKNLLGTLTDGDIRRSLLKKKIFNNSNIKNIYFKKPFYVYEKKYSKKKLLKKILKEKLLIIPVVDLNKKVISYLHEDNLKIIKSVKKFKIPKIPIVIMAGGEGTRLSPFTQVLPKPLIPINSKTALELIIENYINNNQNEFYLSINYKSKIIKAYFNELNPNYKVTFIEEKKPLGTAGSLFLLKNKIKDNFIVCNCDIIANFNLSEYYNFHNENNNDITIMASINSYKIPYGTLNFDRNNKFIKILEKPDIKNYINIGVYLFSNNILKIIKRNTFLNITDLINDAQNKKLKVGVFKISSKKWKDIGEWDKYYKYIKNNK